MNTKVLMFGWELPPHNSGGLGTACYGLLRAMLEKGISVTFVLPRRKDVRLNSTKILFADDVDVKFKEFHSLMTPYDSVSSYSEKVNTTKAPFSSDLIAEVKRYAKAAKKIAKEESFDIIHAHDWLSALAGIAAKEVSGKPLVLHIHATEYDRTGNNINPDIAAIEQEGLEKADLIIAVSQMTKDIIVDKYHIDPNKIKVVHNGVNASDWPNIDLDTNNLEQLKEAGYKIVLYVGRITVQKGVDYLLKAAQQVLKYDPKVYFVIAGSGDMERQIIEQAAYMGISDKVLFAGFLRGQELIKLYRMVDLFVMPSVSEPFGLTALEAVINNTPVLISKQTGVSEVLTHALKVDFWDTEEMANKILAVLLYDSLKLTLKDNALKEAQKQDWKSVADKVTQVYSEHLDEYFT